MYQPPEDYLDILVAVGGGSASHLIHTTQHRCSNSVGEEAGRGGGMDGWKEGW